MAALRRIRNDRHRLATLALATLLASLIALTGPPLASRATTGGTPYEVPTISSVSGVLQATITAEEHTVNIGTAASPVMVHAETYNGTIPGPTLLLNVNDTVIVRLINNLPAGHVTGIHWHGIELENSSDGTPLTQNQVCSGCTYLYKFKVTRPGLFWYHPHHHSSTNQVFRGLYGMIIVKDPHEAALQAQMPPKLPSAAQTFPIVLSDTTVCKAPGMPPAGNDLQTYPNPATLPWVGMGAMPAQQPPTPKTLCETSPIDDNGAARPAYAAGDIPSIQTSAHFGATNEGQTVLTNGVNVGARAGSPSSPGMLSPTAQQLNVQSGQGIRLQFLNAAAIRYFRLRLTTNTGGFVHMFRVGGEGGLLDHAVEEGGIVGGFDTKYEAGEILIPPGSRADVVAQIPMGATGTLTLWTEDYSRTGPGLANTPSVPVMHFNVTGPGTAFTIANGSQILSADGATVTPLPAPSGSMLNPASFVPAKIGVNATPIQLTAQSNNHLGIDTVFGDHDVAPPFTTAAHMAKARYVAQVGQTVELSVQNTTSAHHPFHLHGFSMQPLDLTRSGFPTYTWPYVELRDNIDIPPQYTLRFKIRLDDRPLEDGTTMGGALGRWLFHCHIFFHATNGMISELVVVPAGGNEKPDVNVFGSWEFPDATTHLAVRDGTYKDPDAADAVTLTATKEDGTAIGTLTTSGTPNSGSWHWELNTTGLPDFTGYVYITATDPGGRKDQAVFRLKIGGIDDGADNGDPHLTTVDGTRYDFQAAGEFTLLRGDNGLEVQARQTPVSTATPITDNYSGLTSCVSVNTAVAVQVGGHRVSLVPVTAQRERATPQVFVDGEPVKLSTRGTNLGPGTRVAIYGTPNGSALEIDDPDGTVVTAAPWYWSTYDIWLLNVSILHTPDDEGVMGNIAPGSWLPALPNGTSVGPKPASLHARYVTLYQTFANAWRVTDATSLFDYAAGTSTATFSPKWPPEKPPCVAPPGFAGPNAHPTLKAIELPVAERYCVRITVKDLHENCVFDVASTGDPTVARSYLQAQDLRLRGTTTRLEANKETIAFGEAVTFTATVGPMGRGLPAPGGSVVFDVDGAVGPTVKLGPSGRAAWTAQSLAPGDREVTATYVPPNDTTYLQSTSPSVMVTVAARRGPRQFVVADLAGPAGANGWFTGPVTVTLAGTPPFRYSLDGGATTDYAQPFPVAANGKHTLQITTAGAEPQSVTFQIDASPPRIVIAAPASGRVYRLRGVVRARYSCVDAVSGVARCTGSVRNGGLVDTRRPGRHTFAVTATDNAGNRRVVTSTYTVTRG